MNSKNNNQGTMNNSSKKTSVKKTSKSKKITITKFKDLEGQFLHVKVGDHDRPAKEEDIKSIQNSLINLLEENNVNCLAFVTHHAVDINIIEKGN